MTASTAADRDAMRERAEAWLPLQGEHPINEERMALDVLALLDALRLADETTEALATHLASTAESLAAAEADRDEWKLAAQAEGSIADEFHARLVAAKTSQPDWTPEGWEQFIAAALGVSAHTQDKP